MAYKDKEKTKEYQRQYYWNKTKLKRKTSPAKSYYKKKTPEEIAENRRLGGIKAQETVRRAMGEEAYRQARIELGKKGQEALKTSGKPIGFQAGYAKEASKKSAEVRGLKSKHKKVREKYEA